jgi:hypothetical protein
MHQTFPFKTYNGMWAGKKRPFYKVGSSSELPRGSRRGVWLCVITTASSVIHDPVSTHVSSWSFLLKNITGGSAPKKSRVYKSQGLSPYTDGPGGARWTTMYQTHAKFPSFIKNRDVIRVESLIKHTRFQRPINKHANHILMSRS